MNHSNKSAFGSVDWLMGAVKKNPEGLLLLAAGCALLMRSGSIWSKSASSSSSGPSSSPQTHHHTDAGTRGGRDESGVAKGISRTAESARDYASGVARSMSETASEYASSVGDYADKAKRSVVESSERLAGQAQSTLQSTVDTVLREQPLAVAIAGLAAGALVASAFPSTSIERQTLGPAGEGLAEAAKKAGEQLRGAASAAGERLMDAAEERGLTGSGLKDVASEVAGAFGSAFSGDKKEKDKGAAGSSSENPSISTGSQSASAGSVSRGTSSGEVGSSGGRSSGGSGSSSSSSSSSTSSSSGSGSGSGGTSGIKGQ